MDGLEPVTDPALRKSLVERSQQTIALYGEVRALDHGTLKICSVFVLDKDNPKCDYQWFCLTL